MQPLTVALVDPSPISLLGEIEILLCAGINVAGTLTDLDHLPQLLDDTGCSIAVIAPHGILPDARDGIEKVLALAVSRPSLGIIVLTDEPHPASMRELLGAGVRGIVHKAAPWSDLPAAIYAAVAGRCYLSHAIRSPLEDYPPLDVQ